jgi:hypothetical protein
MDVVLLLGQSNMAGRGAVDEATESLGPNLYRWTAAGAWEAAAEPCHKDIDLRKSDR